MKKILICLIFCIIPTVVFAQENGVEPDDGDASAEQVEISANESTSSLIDFIHTLDFVFQMEPGIYINPESKLVSAPSPIVYPVSIGILWPNNKFIAVQPTLSFFMMNHLWYDGKALPAEIENRTSTTLDFMFTIPVVLSLNFQKSRLQIAPGLSIFARFAMLANNVSSEDSGYSGSAGQDITEINSWFWQNGRFVYVSGSIAWLMEPFGNVKAGPVLNFYVPVIQLLSGEGFQGTVISAGLKISL